MALIDCPECNKQISSAASSCPHCGYPISAGTSRQPPAPSSTSGPPEVNRPHRLEGTKDKPISIASGSWLGVGMHATSAINALLKTDKWERVAHEGDVHGLYCWKVRLPDGSMDEIWFDCSPAADWIRRREAGEVGGILDSVDPKIREQLESVARQHLAKAFTRIPGLIEIHARSSVDAAKQILHHLNKARTDGWTTESAFALLEGWRNEYYISKDAQKSVLAFDMRPTLKHVSRTELTVATMMANAPNADELLKLAGTSLRPPSKGGCLVFLVLKQASLESAIVGNQFGRISKVRKKLTRCHDGVLWPLLIY